MRAASLLPGPASRSARKSHLLRAGLDAAGPGPVLEDTRVFTRPGRLPRLAQPGVLLAELPLDDLAARVLGQRVDDHDVLRALVAGQHRAGVLDDRLGRQLGAGLRYDRGRDRLDPARVRDAEDRDLGDTIELVDRLLDLAGGDVLAAGLDHVLLAVDDVELAGLVDVPEVAGVEPAVAEGLAGLLLVLVVSQGRVRRAVHDLA